jgi:hypothetical protein
MILTKAVSGLARSGATRSGFPILRGTQSKLFAISNIARSGATRSNYHSTKPFITINGVPIAWGSHHTPDDPGILAESLTIQLAVNATPATLSMIARQYVPIEGADVVLTLGSPNNLRREFGGTILSTRHRYVGDKPVAANMMYDVACIDWMWGLGRRKVSGEYTATTVAAIAASLMTYAPTGYTLWVEPDIGAEVIDEISFTETTLANAFSQLTKRVGGDFQCDFLKVVKLFFTDSTITQPGIVNATHPTMNSIAWVRDLSQVITRCLGEFGGSTALEQIAPASTLLPVDTAAWYLAAGGVVLVNQQRVTYGGLVVGGGGSLVGPGAAPTGAPNVVLATGAGVDLGAHDYAVTFRTASGESIPGPRVSVVVGSFLPPTSAPVAGTRQGGPGPDPGTHDYAVTFIVSGGETVPGPRVTVAPTLVDAPPTGPTPDSVSPGAGPDAGAHDYACSFLTATGETPVGPIGSQITTGPMTPPTGAPGVGAMLPGPTVSALPPARYDYALSFQIASGETTCGPLGLIDTTRQAPLTPPGPLVIDQHMDSTQWVVTNASGHAGDRVRYCYSYSTTYQWNDMQQESALSPPSAEIMVLVGVPLSNYETVQYRAVSQPIAGPLDSRIQNQHIWISINGAQWALYATIPASNVQFTLQVNASFENSGGLPGQRPPPAAVYGPSGTVPLSWASGGNASVAFRLYRRVSGSGTLQLVRQFTNAVGQFGILAPTTAPQAYVSGSGQGPLSVGWYSWRVTFVTAEGETEPGPTTNLVQFTNPAVSGRADLYTIPTGAADAGVTARRIYRTTAGGSVFKLVATLNDNTTTFYTDFIADASLGAVAPNANTTGDRVLAGNLGPAAPGTNTAVINTVHVSSIPRGAAGITGRRLYRRSGGAGLRFLATLADNSTSAYTDTTANAGLGAAPPAGNSAYLLQLPLTNIAIGSALVTGRKLYRTAANASQLKLLATLADNVTTTYTDATADSGLGANAPTVSTAQAAQVQLSAIPIGAAAVTARVIYRTKAGLAQLQLLTVIADNVTATWIDTALDATLGANVPTSDTSLLQQPSGNVQAGSALLPCASIAAFRSTGGWAIAGSQNIRYTGITGSNLSGIPATGPGAITATLTFNSTVVAAAMLTAIPASGVGAIKYPILKGDPVNIFVQEDDLDAQAAVRAQIPGSDGIIEDELQDGRLSYTEGKARCRARLDMLGARDADGKVGIITANYVCRDINSIAGATVTINIGPPINLRGDYLIQRVTVGQFFVPNLNPTYTVEASSVRFSAEAFLRAVREALT